ncbi:Crp/Fnr family transcriptional regulator [Variovorax sp. KK3]|uniref:Crp/Fnr family transcriptional regulator n=1 Tax=Variovorax sp. KK3 TaxID=1855728 RepID=UPI00097BAA41|nr:Crp/Fnr family transcriptional regulator [Variovorax sp. KK3]
MSSERSALGLQRIALLKDLPRERLEQLARQCQWQSLPAGQPLMLRSEHKSDVVFLVSGRLRVTTYAASGRQVTFRDAQDGEHFGEISAIDGRPRSADVVTLQPSVVASLDRVAFLALLRDEPAVAERVLRNLAGLVRQLSERVIDLSTLAVQNRVHAELLRIGQAAGVQDNQARLDPAPTHAELASQIGTNREQVTRELNALRRDGLLAKEGRALVLVDVRRLERMVEEVRGAA